MKVRVATVVLAMVCLCAPGLAAAGPGTGSWEVRLGSSAPGPIRLFSVGSNSVSRYESEGTSIMTFGVDGGIGRFLTENFAIGLAGTVAVMMPERGDAYGAFGIAPFFKFLTVPGKVGYFAELSPGVVVISYEDSATFYSLALGGGAEFFVSDSWSIRLGPQYQFLSGEGTSLHIIGINWGLSTYAL